MLKIKRHIVKRNYIYNEGGKHFVFAFIRGLIFYLYIEGFAIYFLIQDTRWEIDNKILK